MFRGIWEGIKIFFEYSYGWVCVGEILSCILLMALVMSILILIIKKLVK